VGDEAGTLVCVVSLEPPHPPYDAPSAGTTPPPPETISLAPNVPCGSAIEARARRELSGYYAHLEATDRAIGRLVRSLRHDRTIVVFTSVHGDMHGAHGLFRKGWPYEESVRIPLLVRLPGGMPRKDHGAISLADLAGMTTRWAEGKDEALAEEASVISMPSVVALPHQCDRRWKGIRSRTRKLILNEDGSPGCF
jgi:arylsulfatase A-like enzyme